MTAFARSNDLRGAEFIGADLRGARFVEAELNRRFPGRDARRAEDPDGLRAAWAALERTWSATLARVAAMPAGRVDLAVGGEWSFAQTLRHLVLATDLWLGRAIRQIEQPFHPVGLRHVGTGEDDFDMSVFTTVPPTYAEVLGVRSGRVAMVRDFLAGVTVMTHVRSDHLNKQE